MANTGVKRKTGKWEQVEPRIPEIRQWRIQDGLCEKDIAAKLGISTTTLETYKQKYPEFKAALQEAKAAVVSDVFAALLKRAKGYDYEEKKVYRKVDDEGKETEYTEVTRKHEPPNVAACSLLLKNLDREHDWSDNPAMLAVKREEAELKKKLAEAENWV